MRKPVLPYANNKGADQPAHLRSLISAFVIHCLKSLILLVSHDVAHKDGFIIVKNSEVNGNLNLRFKN